MKREEILSALAEFNELLESEYNNRPGVIYFKWSEQIDVFRGSVGCATEPYSDDVCGFQIQTVQSLLDEKIARNREKDQKDINMLREYLGNIY